MANLLSIQELQEGIVGDIPSTREGLAYGFFFPHQLSAISPHLICSKSQFTYTFTQ